MSCFFRTVPFWAKHFKLISIFPANPRPFREFTLTIVIWKHWKNLLFIPLHWALGNFRIQIGHNLPGEPIETEFTSRFTSLFFLSSLTWALGFFGGNLGRVTGTFFFGLRWLINLFRSIAHTVAAIFGLFSVPHRFLVKFDHFSLKSGRKSWVNNGIFSSSEWNLCPD